MDSETARLVQSSFEHIGPAMDQVAALFYRRRFELDPVLQADGDSDLPQRGGGLTGLLRDIVERLPGLHQLLPAIQQVGVGKVSKAEIEEHYLPVGAALLWALEQALHEHFTLDVRLAWLEAYTTVVAMLQAAAAPEPGPPGT